MLKSMLKFVTCLQIKKNITSAKLGYICPLLCNERNYVRPFSWTLFLTCAYIYPLEIQNHQRTIA